MRKLILTILILMKIYAACFFLMSFAVHNSLEWTQRQRGFINIPADFSFGSDSAYNVPDTSTATSSPATTQQTTQQDIYSFQTTSNPTTPVKTTSPSENLIYGVKFDCSGKPTGFYKDPKYCDLFHVCVSFVQKKTYPCPQVGGDRFYYDEALRRCESADKNPSGCPSNTYYQQQNQQDSSSSSTNSKPATTTQAVEAWRIYVRKNDPFSCAGKSDGFYASNWCNVFYRCYLGNKFEFLCARQTSGDRLWWNQHSSSQSVAQSSAQCGFPCDLNRACTSSGGVLVENGNTVSDSTSEASRIFSSCSTSGSSSSQNNSSSGSSNSQDDFFTLPEGDNACAGQVDGTFLPDAKYCNIFHVCLGGKRKDFQCAKAVTNQYDLWYNDATKTCEWPCKLKCSKQIFASSGRTAADIQNLDRSLNGADCDASSYYLRKWYSRW